MLRISHTVYPPKQPPFNQWANHIHTQVIPDNVKRIRVYQYNEQLEFIRFHPFSTMAEAIREKSQTLQPQFPTDIFTFKPL